MSRQPRQSAAVRWENWSAKGAPYTMSLAPVAGVGLLNPVYVDSAGRVVLTVGAAPSGAVTVHLERSTDNVTWTDVRGAQAVPLVSGSALVYDYEYSAGVANYYRASFLSGAGAILSRTISPVTPAQTGTWLKNPLRPFLNTRVNVVGFGEVTRQSRSATFDVIGRTIPVAVTDLMSSRGTSYTIRTTSATAADTLDLMIAVGEVLFVQPPYQAAPPTMYAVPGGITRSQVAQSSAVRLLSLAAVEVARPDPSVAAVQSTWQTVVNTYATWQDLVNAKPTWSDVLQLVGSTADVVTS